MESVALSSSSAKLSRLLQVTHIGGGKDKNMERPTSGRGDSGDKGTSGSTHSCCAGLAYYTLAMQQRGAKPVRAWSGVLAA